MFHHHLIVGRAAKAISPTVITIVQDQRFTNDLYRLAITAERGLLVLLGVVVGLHGGLGRDVAGLLCQKATQSQIGISKGRAIYVLLVK